MQFPRKNLANFDLYPFVTVACNSNGMVIYKNELTKKLYRTIHIGAKLSYYTDISLSGSDIVTADFHGDKCTLFVCPLEDEAGEYTVITVFSIGCCNSDVYKSSPTDYKNIITTLLNCEDTNSNINEKRSLIRDIVKKYEIAKKCGEFATLYLENSNSFNHATLLASDFMSKIINIINNRLEMNTSIDLTDETEDSAYIKIDKATVLILLNFVNFVIINSKKNINVTISSDIENVKISFNYYSKHIFENIFGVNSSSWYVFSLLTGIDAAENNGVQYSFSSQGNQLTLDVTLPLIIPKELVFNSYSHIENMIEEYIELTQSIFKD